LYNKGSRVISVTGGEALTRKDIFEIFDYAKSKTMSVNLYVTGLSFFDLITKKLRYDQIDKVLEQVDFIGISINTFHDDAQKEISMESYCDELVKQLVTYTSSNYPNVQIQLFTVLGKYNETDINSIISKCIYIGDLITKISKTLDKVIRWRLSPFRFNSSTMHDWQRKLLLNQDELCFVENELRNKFTENSAFSMHFGVDYDSFFIYPDGKFVTVVLDGNGEDKLIDLGSFRDLQFKNLAEWKRLYESDGKTAKLMQRKDLLRFFK
jgi:MoaA/NifB/PqqE/SkfB family radical SAM enzyme